MRDSSGFLVALQLADSFFPTGMYAHSQGLEGMVRRGLVNSAPALAELLQSQLIWSVLPSDGVALLNAHQSTLRDDLTTIIQVDRLLQAMKLPAEQRAASVQAGRRLLDETAPFIAHPFHQEYRRLALEKETPGNAAVAMGVVGGLLGIDAEPTLLVYCHSFLVSVLGAALRLLRLDHSDAQAILHRLQPVILQTVSEIRNRTWAEMTAFTPQLDIALMGHETDDLRMFAS